MHLQTKKSQGKYISVIKGEILDVVVDLRKNSKTFGQHHSFLLTSNNKRIIYISEGFAHGFKSLEHNSEIEYFCSKPFSKKNENLKTKAFIDCLVIVRKNKDFVWLEPVVCS